MSSFKDRVSDTAGLIIIRGPAWGEDEGKEGLVGDLLGAEDALAEKMAEPVRKFGWAEDDHPRGADGKFGEGSGQQKAPYLGHLPMAEKITSGEAQSLEHYHEKGHKTINIGLEVGAKASEKDQVHIRNLDTAIAKSALPAGAKTFRGTDERAYRDAKPGDVIHEKAYMSTAINRGTAEEFGNTLLVISHKQGQKGLNVAQHIPAGENAHEQEILLPRGERLRVAHVEATPKGKVVHLERLGDAPTGTR